MKNLKNFVLAVEIFLSKKVFAYLFLGFSVVTLFYVVKSWTNTPEMQQLLWLSLTKMWLAIPFLAFHVMQLIAYHEKSQYPGINPKISIFSSRTIAFSYLAYISGIGLFFAVFLGCKAYNFYINIDNEERKPIITWFIWDCVAVITISLIAYNMSNHVTMEDILGY